MANGNGESASEKRTERYKELRRLGFDSRTANKLKDQSGPNIERAITARFRNLKRRKRLSDKEREYLNELESRQSAKAANPSSAIERTYSERDRQAQFEEWTAEKSFPPAIQRIIRELNAEKGKPESDGYGYRQFYYSFVKRRPATAAAKLADRDDS